MNARQVAADVLARSRSRAGFAAELIDDAFDTGGLRPPLGGADRRFVTQLVYGVMRRRATLDALIEPFLHKPLHALQDRVLDVLHLGAFQLAFLTHVPKHAAVHESVELAEHVGSPQAKGFLNGVLRRVSELVTDQFTLRPGPDALPFEPHQSPVSAVVGRYRKLNAPIFPDMAAEPIAYLSAAHSWPHWLAERWFARFGLEECIRLGFWFNAAPPLWIRTNKRNTARESYRLQLAAATIDSEPGEHPQSLRLIDAPAIRDLPGYAAGDFCVQDHSSMLVASAVAPQPGMRVLDLCSAPGGKTTHLAELMDNRGSIVACDIEPKRLDTVTTLCHRLGITIVTPHLLQENAEPPAGPFDAAMVDAPCSNTGVLGRRPEVRWRIKPAELEHLIRLQTKLLFQAIERVKPGGAIIYSTCSIEPDENENVVKGVLRAVKGLRLEIEEYAVPGAPSDGGYRARLRKQK
jgi:16S rRNA (cytosine967-C5)-methyltransferase